MSSSPRDSANVLARQDRAMMSHYSEACTQCLKFGHHRRRRLHVLSRGAFTESSHVASLSIYQPCGLPNCIEPSSKPSHPQDLGIEVSSRSRNRVSHSQPPSENIQPQPLGFPILDKSEESMTHLHLLHLWRHHGVYGGKTRSFSRLPHNDSQQSVSRLG